jgi:PAS domain S-box-containing protein
MVDGFRTVSEVEVPEDTLIVSRSDREGRITFVNQALVDISGYSEDELIGSQRSMLRHPDMPKPVFAELWARIQSGKCWEGLIKNRRKDGTHYWVWTAISPSLEGTEDCAYICTQTRPTRAEIAAAETRYAALLGTEPAMPGEAARGGALAAALRRSLALRIALTFVLLLCLMLVFGGVGYFGTRSAVAALDQVYQDRTVVIVQASKVGAFLNDSFDQLLMLQDELDKGLPTARTIARIETDSSAAKTQLDRLAEWDTGEVAKTAETRFAAAASAFRSGALEKLLAAARDGDLRKWRDLADGPLRTAYAELNNAQRDMFSSELAAAGQAYEGELQNLKWLRWGSAALVLVALLLGFGLGRMLIGSIPGAIRRMKSNLVELALGRLDHRIPDEPLTEFQEINEAVRVLAVRLRFAGAAQREEQARVERRQKLHEQQLERARDLAEAATNAKSSFLAMMSHEIRTPMNGVMSMTEMLEQSGLTDDQRSMAQIIRSSAASLLTIINDILDFSKIEAGKLDIEAVPFSLVELVEGVGELIASRADEKGVGLTVDLDPTIPDQIIGDPTRIRQILLNLMGNAVKFTETGGVVLQVACAGAAEGGLRLRFAIADSGIGLSEEQCQRLFQPFMQADASTARRFGGTGLGLSISQRLCSIMGGTIGVDSVLGRGSTFWFELPLRIADPVLDAPAVAIADARVMAIGFGDADRRALTALLAGAGILAVDWFDAEAPVPPPQDGLPPVVLLSGRGGPPASARLTARARDFAAIGAKPVLVAPRSLGSTLDSAERAGFFTTLTQPVRRHRLWQVIAAALGRAALDRRDGGQAAVERWQPPTLDAAYAAEAAILVAEDNRTNQIVISRLLSQLGYAHEIADNGRQALALWQRHPYGMLLTDFHMPEMDGFELTREVRKAEGESGQHRPIVALTADALPGTGQQCLEAGMDFYLTKPIDSRALVELLEDLLPQAAALRQPVVPPAPLAVPMPDIDPEILNLAQLIEAFGGWTADARKFVDDFLADVPRLMMAITAALGTADTAAARAAAHTLKGAARSSGALRLGQIASDVQDSLDGGDLEVAGVMAELLGPTHAELCDAAAPLLAA